MDYLMKDYGLKQKDLIAELGSQSVASEILSGKRQLNQRQISALSKKFSVSPAAFFD